MQLAKSAIRFPTAGTGRCSACTPTSYSLPRRRRTTPDGPSRRCRSFALGYHGALARFLAADPGDETSAFLPLFEALSWASAIDQRCTKDFAPDGLGDRMPRRGWEQRLTGGADIISGVRFVRNVVHHQWAEAVQPGAGGWCWRAVEELPSRRENSEDYRRELAGRLVAPTLLALDQTFASVARLLDSSGSIAGMGRANRRASQLHRSTGRPAPELPADRPLALGVRSHPCAALRPSPLCIGVQHPQCLPAPGLHCARQGQYVTSAVVQSRPDTPCSYTHTRTRPGPATGRSRGGTKAGAASAQRGQEHAHGESLCDPTPEGSGSTRRKDVQEHARGGRHSVTRHRTHHVGHPPDTAP